MKQMQRYCLGCEAHTLHARGHLSFGLGCIVTLLTGCVFLPFWILIDLAYLVTSPWRCQVCGGTGNPTSAPARTGSAGYVPRYSVEPSSFRYAAYRALMAVERHVKALPATAARLIAGCAGSVRDAYWSLPEWLRPILWGLAVVSPLLMTLAIYRRLAGP